MRGRENWLIVSQEHITKKRKEGQVRRKEREVLCLRIVKRERRRLM